jgi:hypothetical protein
MANALIQNPVDRENHIVHGVKVLGFTSANGRIYDFAAVKEAIQKYEKAPVNKDHNMEEPSFSDRLGWLENVTLEKDGLYADFHYNPHAEGIESFLWFAEHNGLGDVGFSHLVSGKYSVDPDGTERITRIDKVKSVDLVANPATTKTIFESEKLAMKESDEPIYFGSSVTKTFYDKMKKLAASGSEEGKRQVAWIEDGIKKNEKERQIQKDLWAKHLKDKKSKSEQEGEPMGKKVAKEAGNAANKVKKNELDRQQGVRNINKMLTDPDIKYSSWHPSHLKQFDNPKAQVSLGRTAPDKSDNSLIGVRGQRSKNKEQEDDDVGEADSDEREFEMAVDSLDRLLMKDKISQKDYDKKYDELSKKMKDKKRYPVKPEQEGDSEMDNKKMMEEENPMQQQEGEDNPMEEAEDIYAKVKEVCEGEGSDEEKSQKILEMLGLSGGMSEGEGEPMEEAEEDPKEKVGSESAVLEVDDEEEEEPKKESKSELASLRKWKAEKLKEEKIVNLIKESNLEPTKVFIKQLSAIDSKLWSEAINDRKKVALVKSSVKPISSGLQSRSESSYKQFLESVLGK